MKKWAIIKNLKIEKLVFWGKWFAKLKSENPDIDWKTIFVTWWAIPESTVDVKIIRKRKDYLETQIVNIVEKSPIEKKHPNNPYGECWWCKWVNIPYDEQLKIKENQVKESFFHLEKYLNKNISEEKTQKTEEKNINKTPTVPSPLRRGLGWGQTKEETKEWSIFSPIIPSPLVDWYRNKVEFSFGKYISKQNDIEQHFNVWFHKQWMFSQIEDYDGCILIDELQNKIYKEIKNFSKQTWLPVYDQKTQKWFFRHILIRRTFFKNEVMIIFWFNHKYFENTNSETSLPHLNKEGIKGWLENIKTFFSDLAKKYPEIKSIYLSYNDNKADIAIWELKLIHWEKFITETLLWLNFNISPKSFFQTNSHWAEKLYSKVLKSSNNIKNSTVLDLYAWTWTIWMIFAKNWAKKVYSVELVKQASEDWEKNAKLNSLNNIEFINAKVEDFLENFTKTSLPLSKGRVRDGLSEKKADILVIDPPRAWMHPKALPNILEFKAKEIIYVSCNPSTLARDLDYILQNSKYKVIEVTPVDMFPHTHHIEVVTKLELE